MRDRNSSEIAVAFLVRGADKDWEKSVARFIKSYSRFDVGIAHNLYLILKGFRDLASVGQALELFGDYRTRICIVGDDSLDIGAYYSASSSIDASTICFLNTNSEILSDGWLLKLWSNFTQAGVGLVGATGSFESNEHDSRFPKMPNVHVRTNAFMIDKKIFLQIAGDSLIRTKLDAHLFESGPSSLTRAVRARRLRTLVVGRNGRGYSPLWWPVSETFRQMDQRNLLIADNQTRNFASLAWSEKKFLADRTWGPYLDEFVLLKASRTLPS